MPPGPLKHWLVQVQVAGKSLPRRIPGPARPGPSESSPSIPPADSDRGTGAGPGVRGPGPRVTVAAVFRLSQVLCRSVTVTVHRAKLAARRLGPGPPRTRRVGPENQQIMTRDNTSVG